MQYRAGDKVRVRADLDMEERYGFFVPVEEMIRFAGQVVTIRDLLGGLGCGDAYRIEEQAEDSDYDQWWTDEMFSALVVEAEPLPQQPAQDTAWDWETLF